MFLPSQSHTLLSPPSLISPPPADLTALDTFKAITYPIPPATTITALSTRGPNPSSPTRGMWGDSARVAPRVRSVSASSSKMPPPSGTAVGTKVKNKLKRKGRSSRGSSRGRSLSPPRLKVERPHPPHTKSECLSRFVFPELVHPRLVRNLYSPDLLAAVKTLGHGTLKVQYHAGLTVLLQNQLSTMRGIPQVPKHAMPFEDDHRFAAEAYASSLDEWMKAEHEMLQHATKRHNDEIDLIEAWFHRLAVPINDMLRESDTFRIGGHPKLPMGWSTPSRLDAAHRQHDWLAWSDTELMCRAMLSWRMAASDSDICMLYTKAQSSRPVNWKLDVGPGFEINQRNREIVIPEGLQWNSAVVALLAWQGLHHYRTRWGITFNGGTALVTYLAKSDTLFISEPIWRHSGQKRDALTIAGAMFALCAMNHHNDSNRPSVTMRDDAIQFYTRPGVTTDEWLELERHEELAHEHAL